MTARTRLIILNSPHNPAGAVLTAADIAELSALVDGTDLLIVADEVYEHIIFDGIRHESMARHDVLAARSFVVGSFGKTYHTTGWKVGYVAAPAALTSEFRKVHQFVTFSTNTPVQHAIADFLETRRGLAELSPFFQGKRDLFLRLMAGSASGRLPAAQQLSVDGLLEITREPTRVRDPPDGEWRRVDSDIAVPRYCCRERCRGFVCQARRHLEQASRGCCV